MSKFDDMINWASGYTRSVNERKALELKEREVKALERLAAAKYNAIAYVSKQLEDGCAYVIVPNGVARPLIRAVSDWERDSTGTETIREKRKP